MGKPVRIVDLAKKMISLSGLRKDIDIQIKYTGLRPGEKLYEELLYKRECTMPTDNPKIFRAQTIRYEHNLIREHVNHLLATAYTYNKLETVRYMKLIDPEFVSQSSIYESLDSKTKEVPLIEKKTINN